MKNIIKTSLLGSLLVLSVNVMAGEVSYPDGYRNWHHVKSMIINPGHPLHDAFGGIHHIYANEKSMKGYKKWKF